MEATLLVELLTEELPPKSLASLGGAFTQGLYDGLVLHRLLTEPANPKKILATPRRLAATIPGVLDQAEDRPSEVAGPSIKAPAEAVAGFAKKHGLDVEALDQRETPKGKVFVARVTLKGARLDAVLGEIVNDSIRKLPIPKMMRWGAGDAQFVRPVHGLVMLHGARVVPGTVLGMTSGNRTAGHRFMGKQDITLARAEDYEATLRDEGVVIADFAARRAEVERQLKAEAERQHAALGPYEELLDEVTALVEHPNVYVGKFEPKYLDVPQECLILTMRQNQKYFPLFDPAGKLLPKFLIVSNMKVADPRHITGGNERVVRPRLGDARFFYDQDRKVRLETRVPQLARVVYHNKLGSQLERVQRIQLLAGSIARRLKADTAATERAAWLSKADLLTGMVGEFPELQGIMGRYYALNDGESPSVANAIELHYRPRFAGDRLPEEAVSISLALADKLELIAGMFGINQKPSADKDPYALRRHALGVVRILIEKQLGVGLLPLVDEAIAVMPANARADWQPIVEFILDRARSYFSEQGYASVAIEAVLTPFGAVSWLYTLPDIVAEAAEFISTEDGRILAEANKRITNILKKSGYEVPFGFAPEDLNIKPDVKLFREKAEIEFWDALQKVGVESLALKRQQKFAESLRVLSRLGAPTQAFFKEVMVNVEDPAIRDNRITLLQHARAYMNQVADLSLMAA